MNPAPVDGARNVFRVPQHPGDRRKRDQGAAEQFQRALQERARPDGSHDGAPAGQRDQPPAPPAAPAAARAEPRAPATAPAARALQRLLADGRREGGTPPRHVDVIA